MGLSGTSVLRTADVSVDKDGPFEAIAGSTVAYDITVENDSSTLAADVTVTDTIPAGATFVSVDAPAGWTCDTPPAGEAGTVECNVAMLVGGAADTITIVVRLDDDLAHGATVTNQATVSTETHDPDATNNESGATVIVRREANPDVVASVSHFRAEPGDHITYLIDVENHGPNDAGQGTLWFALPANAALVSFDAPAGWTCDVPAPGAPGEVECSFAAPVGELQDTPAELVLAVGSGAVDGDTVQITFMVDSDTADPDHSNNMQWLIVGIETDDGSGGPGDEDPVVYELGFRWTLITWAGEHGMPPAEAFADILESVTAVYAWDGGDWLSYFPGADDIPGVNDLESMEYGAAYWVAINEPNGVIFEVSPGTPQGE